MRKISLKKTLVCGVGLALVSTAGGQTYPTLLYGTTTALAPTSQFAITTTLPTFNHPRAEYVVIAEENADTDLEVRAWHDTTSSLDATAVAGIAKKKGVMSVAITGLDSCRVVTADVNHEGILSVRTWTVRASGVHLEKHYHTAAGTAAANVAIATVSSREVVTAYETPEGQVVVEAWKIEDDGRPVPKAVKGKGPIAFEVSIAAINSHQVITAAGNASQSLWTNTWDVDGAGVHAQDQVETKDAVSGPALISPAVETVAAGAGRSIGLVGTPPAYEFVDSAFTPVITPDFQVQVFYWGVSHSGMLTLNSTAPPTLAGDFYGVAASMLPRDIPITTYFGGTGDNHVSTEVYTGLNPFTDNPPTYGDPYGALAIATAAAGTDFNCLSLFNPYNAYFVSGGSFGAPSGSPDGTLFINVFSYPEAPIL